MRSDGSELKSGSGRVFKAIDTDGSGYIEPGVRLHLSTLPSSPLTFPPLPIPFPPPSLLSIVSLLSLLNCSGSSCCRCPCVLLALILYSSSLFYRVPLSSSSLADLADGVAGAQVRLSPGDVDGVKLGNALTWARQQGLYITDDQLKAVMSMVRTRRTKGGDG